jgi:phage-related protein
MIKKFEVIVLNDAYLFMESLPRNVRSKILQNIRRSQYELNPDFFKKLRNDIWEFRSRMAGNQYRLLAFWDKSDSRNTLIIATHGFIKKRNSIPKNEIN